MSSPLAAMRGEALRGVGEDVAVGQHHALGHAFRARREEDDGGIVAAGAPRAGAVPARMPAILSPRPIAGAHVLQVDDAHVLLELGDEGGQAAPCSTNARDVSDHRDAGGAAGRLDVGGAAVKLIMAGTRPIACSAKNVTRHARRVRQHHADRSPWRGASGSSLAPKHLGAQDQLAVAELRCPAGR